MRSHRKAGFGYGLKYDFTKAAQKTPAPNVYVLPSDFKEKGKGMRGISFGVSRDVRLKRNYLNFLILQ